MNENDKEIKITILKKVLELIKNIPNFSLEIWYKIKIIFKLVTCQKNQKDEEKNKLEIKEDFNYEFNNKYNNDHFNKGINENNEIQILVQTDKQKLKQLESQTYSNRTMARLISTAELYALSVNCKNSQLYKKFDEFDNLNRKSQNEIKGELIIQIECFKISYQSYVKKYKHYDFPDDYDNEKTIEELENIERNINENDKKFYQAIIKLLKGNTNIPSFDEELDELEEGDDKKDPLLQIKTDIPVMRHLNGIKKNLKKQYLDDPLNCKIKLNLDEPIEKNEELQELVKELDSIKKQKEEKNEKCKLLIKSPSFDSLIFKRNYLLDNEEKLSRSTSSGILSFKEVHYFYNDKENSSEHSCCNSNCDSDFEEEDLK